MRCRIILPSTVKARTGAGLSDQMRSLNMPGRGLRSAPRPIHSSRGSLDPPRALPLSSLGLTGGKVQASGDIAQPEELRAGPKPDARALVLESGLDSRGSTSLKDTGKGFQPGT